MASWVDGSLLSFLTRQDAEHLLGHGVSRSFQADELLLREGDPTQHLLLLVSGWVRVSTVLDDGREVLYALRGPGDVLGELAAVLWRNRTASVRTIESVTVAQWTGEDFLQCLHSRPTVAVALIKALAVRLRQAEAARVDIATVDVSRRVATYLLRLARDHGTNAVDGIQVDVPLTQQDIANRVGASLRAVARALAVLRERGVVHTARKRIVVARPEVLAALARSCQIAQTADELSR